MELAGEYAYAGRDTVVAKVLEILGAEATYEVHNHHNFAWRERHFGTDVWVIRKGCTPAFPGQEGFVGATMGEPSVILRGADGDAGAGPAASRPSTAPAGSCRARKAAGKSRPRWTCPNRDCDWFAGPGEHKPADGACPVCGHAQLAKRRQQLSPA